MPIKIRINFRIEGEIKPLKTIIIENFFIIKPELPTLLKGTLHTKEEEKHTEKIGYEKG